jgi:hypothetical protein
MPFALFEGMSVSSVLLLLLELALTGWASIVLTSFIHEGGHALAGRCQGLTGARIVLHGDGGGYCLFDETPENARIYERPSVRMILGSAGCLANLIVGVALLPLAFAMKHSSDIVFGPNAPFIMLLILHVFAFLNLMTSVGCLIPRSGPNQDYTVIVNAWRDYRASRQSA